MATGGVLRGAEGEREERGRRERRRKRERVGWEGERGEGEGPIEEGGKKVKGQSN